MKAEIDVEFTESPNRQEIQSGEEIKTLFGKIKKWLTDLKAVAFSGSYSDLTGTPSSLPADGGNADSADKLNTNAGSSTKPVYFSGGIPVSCSYTLAAACSRGVDTSAKSGSTNLITSGAMYTALAGKASSFHTHNYAGASSAGGAALTAVADSTGADIAESFADVRNYIAINRSTMGMQCRNLLNNTAATKTASGITFTVNSDKSVTVNGTATATAQLVVGTITKDGNYILTGCPSGGSASTYMLSLAYLNLSGTTTYGDETGSGRSVVFDSEKYSRINVRIQINKGVTVSNITFYPMLRDSEVTDSIYEPYQPSIKEELDSLRDYIDQKIAEIS